MTDPSPTSPVPGPAVPEEAVEAAAKALSRLPMVDGVYRQPARVALAAAFPLLVAEAVAAERERIASEIEGFAREDSSWYEPVYEVAARIARGTEPNEGDQDA